MVNYKLTEFQVSKVTQQPQLVKVGDLGNVKLPANVVLQSTVKLQTGKQYQVVAINLTENSNVIELAVLEMIAVKDPGRPVVNNGG